MTLERGANVENGTSPNAVRWYQPVLAATRLVGPLVVLLYALDGHPVRDFFSLHFLRLVIASIVAGSAVLYAGIGIARWRRRTRPDGARLE